MSNELMLGLATIIATAISTILTYLLTMWVNKRKIPAEVEQIGANTRLTNGDLVEKYQTIAGNQANENLELSKTLQVEKKEKQELAESLGKLRQDMDALDQRYKDELTIVKCDFDKKFDAVSKENENLRDWARRLVLQLQSFGIQPTPFDLEEAKKRGFSTGESGPCS